MRKGKYLFCRKCCDYPTMIYEEYSQPPRQRFEWTESKQEYEELEPVEWDGQDTMKVCSECGTELLELEFDELTKKQQAKIIAKRL